jgi:hypothetical protein
MPGRGQRGPDPQCGKREEWARLIALGMSNSEACRIVGMNRRTGKRWRHGRTITGRRGQRYHYPPVINKRERVVSARFLSEEERFAIADLHRAGHGVHAIAPAISRSLSQRPSNENTNGLLRQYFRLVFDLSGTRPMPPVARSVPLASGRADSSTSCRPMCWLVSGLSTCPMSPRLDSTEA